MKYRKKMSIPLRSLLRVSFRHTFYKKYSKFTYKFMHSIKNPNGLVCNSKISASVKRGIIS